MQEKDSQVKTVESIFPIYIKKAFLKIDGRVII